MAQLSLCTTSIEPVLYSPEASATESMSCNYWSLQALEPMLHNKRGHRNEKPMYHS